jgi:hypothetical protein
MIGLKLIKRSRVLIVLFHENVLLLSTYKFMVIPIKYRNFEAFVYDSAEKKSGFSQSIFMPCEGDITFWKPADNYF